jgi:hypothetical protein
MKELGVGVSLEGPLKASPLTPIFLFPPKDFQQLVLKIKSETPAFLIQALPISLGIQLLNAREDVGF